MALIPNGLYNIVNAEYPSTTPYLYMSLHEGDSGSGIAIIGNVATGGANQKWWVTWFPDASAYVIMNAMTGTYVSSVQTASPDPPRITLQSNVNPDYFTLAVGQYAAASPSYNIYPVTNESHVIDLQHRLGPEIIFYPVDYPYQWNQQWFFQPLGDDGTLGDQD